MIKKDETYTFEIPNVSFGDLSREETHEVLRDGRFAAPFLERQLTKCFPELTHVKGNKDHDHINDRAEKFDAKNFTHNGLKFMPSKMIGVGRKVDIQEVKKKASKLTYICCDIIDFPRVRVRFVEGSKLIEQFPSAVIPRKDREVFFS